MLRKLKLRYYERVAFNAFVQSRFALAEKYFEKMQALQPERQGLRLNRGLAELSRGEFENALKHFQEERELFGFDPHVESGCAEAAFRMGNREVAAKSYAVLEKESASEKERNFAKLRKAICEDAERFAAVEKARELIAEGDALMLKKQFDDALPLFEKVIEMDDTSYHALNNVGAILMKSKEYDRALEFFTRADALVDVPMIKKNIAYIHEQKKREQNR